MNPDTYSAEPTVCREERETSVADSTTKGSPESEATEGSSTSDKEDQETKQCNDVLDTSAEETDQQNCGDNPNNSTSPDEQLDDGDFDMPMISKPAQTTRHRSRITYGRKKELCLYKMEHPKASLNHLTKYFSRKWSTHVGRTTVCDILLHSQKWLSMPPDCHDMLRNTPPKYIKLDNALYSWYIEAQKKYGSSLTNDILIAKAKELGKKMNITDLSYSSGWLYSFKRRHKLLNPPTSSASRENQSFGSITGQRSLYNLMSRAVAGDNMAHRAGLANRLNSGQQSDVMYPSDDNMGMPGMPQNVSFVEACQGLLTVISYLGSHREFGDDYLPFLWQIFQHICNQTQNDLMRAKQEQHLASENGFQMSMSSEREAAEDLGTSEERSNEVHSEDSMPKIKTEHLDPHYDQAMSGSQGDVGTAERSHPCSRCGQRFVVLTQLLDHMTNHVLADAQAHDMASDYSTNSKNDTSDNLDKADLEGHSSRAEQMTAPRESLSGDGQQVNTKDHMSTTESSSLPLVMPGASSTGADCNGITSTATQGEMDELEMLKAAYRKSYKCEICGREFGNYSNFRRHVRLHSGRKPHKCTVCGKAFADPGSLQKHGTVHTGEKPYLCTVCGKRLTQATGLALHMRRHTGERPYECTVCGRRFAQSSSLREHSRVHTGEKPYHCSICDKRFPRSSDLVAHKRVHTGERPYQCTVCGKCFTQRGNLSKHGRAHTGEKPHKCSTCGKSFAEKCLLTAHVRVHTGERPFCCTLCGKTFSQSGSLFHHMKMHK